MQLELFETLERPIGDTNTAYSDPNFASNKNLPVHRWVPWIAGFSSSFVRSVLKSRLSSPSVVLDPFAGVGTTLVEAALLGHEVIGFEINPYAAMACRVKMNARNLNSEAIRAKTRQLAKFYNLTLQNGYNPKSESPPGFRTRKQFYSPDVLRKVLIFRDFMEDIENECIKDVFQVAFAATMVQYSNYSYEPSLGTRSAAGKNDIIDFPVLNAIAAKLNEIAGDIEWLATNAPAEHPRSQIINASFFECKALARSSSVDLAITSPPYLNNYHYIRNTRPHLYWLGFAEKPKDIKPLEDQNFGKFWQNVRGLKTVDLDFPNPPTHMTETLAHLRSLNTDRGVYGGNGWANYAAAYFNDCYRFAQGLRHILKPGGSAFVVIGNSILQGVMIPTDQYLGQIAECAGLQFVSVHTPRDTRVGNSIIQSAVRVGKAKDLHRLYESVVELRQPK